MSAAEAGAATTPDFAARAGKIVADELGEAGEGRPICGVAFSGGGIRSATFNLGVLQTLHRVKLLERFDYLATVSGGGYVGGFWSAFRHREPRQHEALSDAIFPGPGPGGGEALSIRHLRQFSNFLAPQLGFFSIDTWSLLGAWLRAMVPSLLAAVALLVVGLDLWVLLAAWALSGGGWAIVTVVAIAALVHLCAETTWRSRRHDQPAAIWYFLAGLLALAVTGAVAGLGGSAGRPLDLLFSASPYGGDEVTALLWPAVAFAAGGLVLIVLRFLTSRLGDDFRAMARRAAVDRAMARALAVSVVWTLLALLWLLGHRLALEGAGLFTTGVAGGAGGLFALVRKSLFRQPSKPGSSSVGERLKPLLPALLAYAAVIALVAAIVVLLHRAYEAVVIPGWERLGDGPFLLGVIALLVGLGTLVWLDPEEVSAHAFYRDRLVRAYLGAANPAESPEAWRSAGLRDDDLRLSEIQRGKGPFHLVCCAANDLSPSDPLKHLQRGSRSATLSSRGLTLGSAEDFESLPWTPAHPSPRLGSALTASAAAFNSLMGDKTRQLGPAVVFLMAALNLRLGLWVLRPGKSSFFRRAFPGLLFFRELLGITAADDNWIHLSDGAHFENLGLYELLRRRCTYILVSDCGCDPEVVFDDFARALRRAREDLGVEIDIDLRPLVPDEHGRARQPMVAGDIRYVGGETGVLLYLKPTLTGDEPPDIIQYDRRNRDFPHETTGDQFYDEAQWESYRRLGEHVADEALRGPLALARRGVRREGGPRSPGGADSLLVEVFDQARFAWLPLGERRPEGFAKRLRELDALLDDKDCPELAGQLRIAPEDAGRQRCLEVILEALSILEEGYRALDLGTVGDHPAYLGVMNAFGRWLGAPAVAEVWPLVRALVSPQFAHWAEESFGLGCESATFTRRVIVHGFSTIGADDELFTGYAGSRWRALCGKSRADARAAGAAQAPKGTGTSSIGLAPDGATHLFELRLEGQGISLQAALLFARSADDRERRLIVESGWLYVPPGLWGLDLGTTLITRVRNGDVEAAALAAPPVREHGVRAATEASAAGGYGAWELTPQLDPEAPGYTEERQLYRAAGIHH